MNLTDRNNHCFRLAAFAAGALLLAAAGALLRAQQDAGERAVVWARAREAADRYRSTSDASGLVDVAASFPMNMDATDLADVCRARDEAVRRARARNEVALMNLGIDTDPGTSRNRALLEYRLGAVAAYTGDLERSLSSFERARKALAVHVADYPDIRNVFLPVLETFGAANLRRGEVDNCMAMPNADRCLFPVLTGGQHQQRAGAEAAAAQFLEYLRLQPDDLEVRWLLNLSYMLLGTYPSGVPAEHLLEPDLFRSKAAMPRFVDVAARAGLGAADIAGGTIADDFDGDGLTDVLFTSVDHCKPARLYRNRGDGTFEDRTSRAGLSSQLGAINAVQADYDNDGRIDVFLMRGGWEFPIRNSLLRNKGDGTFTDVTREAGLLSGTDATHSVAWGDYDNDGWIDLFAGHELTPGRLFHNRGDGTFEDITKKAGIDITAVTKGVVFGDYDNDGYPDLYLLNIFGDNTLYHNNGNGTFSDVTRARGVEKPAISFPTWFFDYDNDGWLDIFMASYPNSVAEFLKHYLGMPAVAETLTLYRNRGDGTFTDVTREIGLDRVVPAMGSNFGDLDNDGYLDIYLGTGTPSFSSLMPNIVLKNEAGHRFVDVTEAAGMGQLQKGHGVAFTDIDNDGDEDVILNSGGAVPGDWYGDALFENPGAGAGNHWISVRLVGSKSNRAAIGAKIRVRLRGVGEDSAQRYREVTSGGSFGANSLMQHIGLGKRTISSLEIEWPVSRTKQVFRDVPVDVFLEIREGAERYTVRHVPRVTLKTAKSG